MSRRVEEPSWTRFDPLDMWCADCNASPGCRCVWTTTEGVAHSRRPHAVRVSDARNSTDRARKRAQPRRPGWSVWPPPPGSTG